MPQKTLRVFGMDLPIVADLPQDYSLVLHRNGPAIANATSMALLEMAAGNAPPEDADLFDEKDEDGFDLPYDVRTAAIRAYVEWSWKKIQGIS